MGAWEEMTWSPVSQPAQGPRCLGIPRTLGEHPRPVPRRLGPITLLLRQPGQVPPRDVAEDPRVDAGELLGPAQGQAPPPADPGPIFPRERLRPSQS